MTPKPRKIRMECMTMGHDGCVKYVSYVYGRTELDRIEHKVYGRKIIERFV